MQFTLVALLSLVAVAFASPIAIPQRLDDRTAAPVNAEAASMSAPDGSVVDFNSATVFKSGSQ